MWFLFFCTQVAGGAVCLPPQTYASQARCNAVAGQLMATARRVGKSSDPKATCVKA